MTSLGRNQGIQWNKFFNWDPEMRELIESILLDLPPPNCVSLVPPTCLLPPLPWACRAVGSPGILAVQWREESTEQATGGGGGCSVSQSCPTLWPHGLQHTRPPCLSPSPEVCPSSCSLHPWWVVVLSAFSSSWFCSSSTPYLKGNTKHGPLFIHLEIPFSSSLSFQKFIWIIYKRRKE